MTLRLGLPMLLALGLALSGCKVKCISDNDNDGFFSTNLCDDGTDCNDLDPEVKPGAVEVCDGVDNDCDGAIDNATDITVMDADGDGYMSDACSLGTDCDDTRSDVSPGGIEICDGVDEDCNGIVDDKDSDGDGAVDSLCGGSDCDDEDPALGPDVPEDCHDGIDNNCNGTIDGADADGDGYASDECPGGDDCNDADPYIHPGEAEFCDDIDQDCDGLTNDVDVDGDGDISPDCGGDDCDDNDPTMGPSATDWCDDGIDNNCDGVLDFQDDDGDLSQPTECGGNDCDDHDATTSAGMTDICGDGADNDCNGTPDDKDEDEDGAIDVACGGTDCDDADPTIGSMPEQCDAIDADCDGDLNDADFDADGEAALSCGGGDCNDSLPNVGTFSPEVCDGIDNDCDGVSDPCDQALPGAFDFERTARGWVTDTGWVALSGAASFTGVGDGAWHNFGYQATVWEAPYLLEVDITRTSGDPTAGAGIAVCQTLSCNDGVYAWMQVDDGFRVQVGRIDHGVYTAEHAWRPTSAGYQGLGFINRLRIYHSGGRFYAYVNGVEADSLYASDMTDGYVVIMAEDVPDSGAGLMAITADNVYGTE